MIKNILNIVSLNPTFKEKKRQHTLRKCRLMSSYVAFCRQKEGVRSLLLTNKMKKDQNPNL